jgi:hypothetical protein
LSDHFLPVFVLILVKVFREDLLALFSKSHDLLADGAGPACLLLMEIVEHSHPRASVTIIGNSLGEDRDKG